MVFFVMTVAAAEAAVGLAIILAIFRHKQSVDLQNINLLQGLMNLISRWSGSTVALPLAGLPGRTARWRSGGPQAKDAGLARRAGRAARARSRSRSASSSSCSAQPPHAPIIVTLWPWLPVGRLQVDLAFQVDQLSAVMLLVVTGVGSLIHLFSVGYMQEDPGYARYFAYLNLFVVFMLVLVLGVELPGDVRRLGRRRALLLPADRLLVQRQGQRRRGQEGVHRQPDRRLRLPGRDVPDLARRSGRSTSPTWSSRRRQCWRPAARVVTAITLFLFLGCTGKSAQIPLYTWLPDAMAGPTPVSALIHAATMVTAASTSSPAPTCSSRWRRSSSTVVAGIGALTALFAATIGLRQYDIKKVLAYSTVSQLGYMFLGVGTGAYAAGVFHLVTHAFFKALLFLGAGSVIHAMHHAYHATHSHDDAQDMRNMGGLRQYMPCDLLAHADRDAGDRRHPAVLRLLLQGRDPRRGLRPRRRRSRSTTCSTAWASLAALLTAFYMARLMAMTFLGANRTGEQERAHLHEAPWIMTGPLVVLGVLSAGRRRAQPAAPSSAGTRRSSTGSSR